MIVAHTHLGGPLVGPTMAEHCEMISQTDNTLGYNLCMRQGHGTPMAQCDHGY